tara:strand:- start:3398 stop:4810 length:1413 start_codon:yes stop_codon:yes gene_type:complete
MNSSDEDIADFSPSKRFFVNMLTRDISLEDAVLDLLDNCMDGVIRTEDQATSDGEVDYSNYWAKIYFDANSFRIKDNCGGIPKEKIKYAFRIGKPSEADEHLKTVGMYGVGMKRALFKMGFTSTIDTQHAHDDSFSVKINEQWLSDSNEWTIPVTPKLSLDDINGTEIKILDLYESISKKFRSTDFLREFKDCVRQTYSYIIEKGFKVFINDELVEADSINLIYESPGKAGGSIAPYIYQGDIDGVNVELTVGFYRPSLSEEEQEEELVRPKFNSNDAGWTIICNDRVVLYKDKSRLTGWGVSGIPSYHTQFIGIAGMVFINGDPSKLPLTTTKRGIDASSDLYLKIKDHMMEGMKLFTSYTNAWKGKENLEASNARISMANLADPQVIAEEMDIPEGDWTQVRGRSNERKYKPTLPKPPTENRKQKIVLQRSPEDIEAVREYLGMNNNSTPSEVGDRCFDRVLAEADEK